MTDNTENPQKKVHLIKQPKPLQSEATPFKAKSEEEIPVERKKVVVVKKKLVLKKTSAKVVARRRGGTCGASSGEHRHSSSPTGRGV